MYYAGRLFTKVISIDGHFIGYFVGAFESVAGEMFRLAKGGSKKFCVQRRLAEIEDGSVADSC